MNGGVLYQAGMPLIGSSRRGRRTLGRGRHSSVLILLLVAGLLGSCRSDSDGADAKTSTTTTAATSSTASSAQSDVVAAWRRYWDVYVAVGRDAAPRSASG